MAKVKGLIQFVGTLNGINFYMRKGELIARAAGGGFNGEAIKTKPSMEKVRQNGSEFGQVSKMVKAFKVGIAPLLFSNTLPELHGRLMRLFSAVKNEDLVSERGSRTFAVGLESLKGRRMLIGFSIPEQSPNFGKFYSNVDFDWSTFSLSFTARKADLFSFSKTVVAVSFQVGILKLGTGETGCELFLSEAIFITAEDVLPDKVFAPAVEVGSGRCLAIVSMHQYERIGGVLYPIGHKNAFLMEVVSVF